MRRTYAAVVAGLLVTAAHAWAQSAESLGEPPIVYDNEDEFAAEIASNFPRNAYRRRQDGQAALCCLIRPNGSLQCAVTAESPLDEGFGEAARRVSGSLRLTRESTNAWRAYGQPLRMRIIFRGQRFSPAPDFDETPRCGTRASDEAEESGS